MPATGLWVDGREAPGDPAGPARSLVPGLQGVFTTARIVAGAVVRAALHRARLEREAPTWGGSPGLVAAAWNAAERAAASAPDASMLRVLLGRDAQGAERWAVAWAPARRPVWAPGEPCLRLGIRPDPRASAIDPWGPAKSLDREALDLADAAARGAGSEAALLVGPEGVREGTWFHLWARTDEGWVTPPLGPHVLWGTTRAALLDGLTRAGGPVRQATLPVAALADARSLMASSALLEVAPVGELDGQPRSWLPKDWAELRRALDLAGSA